MPGYTLPKCERLKASAEYRQVMKNGCSYKSSNLILRTLANSSCVNRLGVVVAKGVAKNAAERNYSRRLLKEAYRMTKPHKCAGVDIVAILLRRPGGLQALKDDMSALLAKAGIL